MFEHTFGMFLLLIHFVPWMNILRAMLGNELSILLLLSFKDIQL
jgi:hypothetical protein